MEKKIIIAGGGTGGHIFPAIAIANSLRRRDPQVDILFVGARGKMEMEKVPQAGYRIIGLDIAGFNRSSLLKNITLPFKLIQSLLQARKVLTEFRPRVVIGVGGYASFPMLWLAQRRGIPTVIQEQNSYAGKSNRILGKKARRVCVAYEQMQEFFPVEHLVMTGNPVRNQIVNSAITREEAIRSFELDPQKQTVLIVGGSLGARSINEAVDKHLRALLANEIQVIWQTGKPFSDRARAAVSGLTGVKTMPFITDMERAYAAADMVVSRAGAMAIAELCVVGKPVIFVPYPFAAEDHQTVNAQRLVEKNAAWMVRDQEVAEKLMPLLLKLAREKSEQAELSNQIKKLAITDADDRIASEVMALIL